LAYGVPLRQSKPMGRWMWLDTRIRSFVHVQFVLTLLYSLLYTYSDYKIRKEMFFSLPILQLFITVF